MSYSLPTSINVGGVDLRIRGDGDYRIVLDTFSVLDDLTLSKEERLITAVCLFYDDFNDFTDAITFGHLDELISNMFKFFNAGKPEQETKSSLKYIDWEDDSAIICAAVNSVANREIRQDSYLHWWTFMSYYMSIGESVLSTVVAIREKILKGKKLESWERKYRMENPQYFKWNSKTADEIETEQMIFDMWNSGS